MNMNPDHENDLDPLHGVPDVASNAAGADLPDELTMNANGAVRGLKGAQIVFKEPVRPVYDLDGNPIGVEGGDVAEHTVTL